MHTAAGWSEYDPLYGQIDKLLGVASTQSVHSVNPWVEKVEGELTTWQPSELVGFAVRVLDTIPIHKLRSQLENYRAEDPEDLRYTRKFLMVARDALILSTSDIPNERYDPLFRITRYLGKIADGETLVRQNMSTLINELESSSITGGSVFDDVKMQDTVRSVLAETVPVLSGAAMTDPTYYHQCRKDFRRIVHATMVRAVVIPSAENIELAVRGITINRTFGAIKDELFDAM